MTKQETCRNCDKPVVEAFMPFCSKRCADIDLGRWLKGGYVIPGRDGEAVIPANDKDTESDL